MSLRVFVAAPFEMRLYVRDVHDLLREHGMTPTAHWCNAEPKEPDEAGSPVADWFESLSPERISGIIARNDNDLGDAHVVLMLAQSTGGRESYAEVARALTSQIPVVWTGPTRALTAYRPGVKRIPDSESPVAYLKRLHAAVGRPWPQYDNFVREACWKWVRDDARGNEA